MKSFKEFIAESSFKEYIDESSLSRIWRKYKDYDSGTISAYRGDKTTKENRENTARLRTELVRRGFSVTAIDGVYIENYGAPNAREVNEKSFIVFDYQQRGNLKQTLIELGIKYEQDCVTFNHVKSGVYYLLGTKEGVHPGYGVELPLGKPMFGEGGEFLSRVKGRPFVFKKLSESRIIDNKLTDYNISRIRTIKYMEDFVIPD